MTAHHDASRQLHVIYERISARSEAIAGARPAWPCRKGCDNCCRRLASAPELTAAEWEPLWRHVAALDAGARRAIRRGVEELARELAAGATQVTCPLLDREAGTCRVYAVRPAACRMYGFYVSRGDGMYCDRVQAGVDAGEYDDVVWGNHDAVDRDLERAFGPRVSLLDWLVAHPEPDDT